MFCIALVCWSIVVRCSSSLEYKDIDISRIACVIFFVVLIEAIRRLNVVNCDILFPFRELIENISYVMYCRKQSFQLQGVRRFLCYYTGVVCIECLPKGYHL